ncbi:unnamed protein product [Ilex paraguariensis]|uniref:AB hydrolase-1 domain-containing protein n=1 Tax=Ilex paraguariensis TaxID=185542 RepID=A0ABC8S226_9AQUA
MMISQSDFRSALQIASTLRHRHQSYLLISRAAAASASYIPSPWSLRLPATVRLRARAFSTDESAIESTVEKLPSKPSICTADELHYVSVNNSNWRLALWRYTPSPQDPPRNHPLLLLSGVGTNAIGYDLSPESSFARYMCGQGFDTWILEVRGAGLSMQGSDPKKLEPSAHAISEQMEAAVENATNRVFSAAQQSTNVNNASAESGMTLAKEDPTGIATVWDESKLVTKLTETFMLLSERLSGFLSEGQSNIMSAKLFDQISRLLEDSFLYERFDEIRGKLSNLLETRQSSAVASQIRDLSQKLVNIFGEGQLTVSPQLFDLQERLITTIDDFQKQLDLIVKYDWDFDHYLEEDIPAVVSILYEHKIVVLTFYIVIDSSQESYLRGSRMTAEVGGCEPRGYLFDATSAFGVSLLSCKGYEGRESGLAAVVTLASSLDYTSSKSSLKLLLPLADPAQAFNVPVVPLGALLAAAYPLSSRPPYVLSWLNHLISAEDMMKPELLKKLVLNNFCTIPAKLILQLTTAFREGGLCDRSGTFFYKDHLHKSNVPVLAIAGDRDLICPPEAVYETVNLIPEHLVTYKIFGEPDGPHYAHYDLVGGQLAVDQVYPCIIQFLSRYDLI